MTRKQWWLVFCLILLWPSFLLAAQKLKQSTATQVTLKFVDSVDGVTAETGLTVTTFDCNLVKQADSGMAATALTVTASGGVNDAAHLADGIYSLELTASNTDTLGRLDLYCQCSGAAPYEAHFQVSATSDPEFAGDFANTSDVVAAIYENAVPGSYTAGQAGYVLGNLTVLDRWFIRTATAQAGAPTTITLDTGASTTDDFYNYKRIVIASGTGAGQSALIADYVGSTRVATIFCEGTTTGTWRTNPAADSVFVILPRNRQ